MITAINSRNETIQCRRTWSVTINIVQMEDTTRFGNQFRSIPILKPHNVASMMTWTLCSILSSVKELWHTIDSMTSPFRHNGWEGYLLTFIQSEAFSFQTIRNDPKPPFRKIKAFTKMINKINEFAPIISDIDEDGTNRSHLYKFSIEFMRNIFAQTNHPTILVSESVIDVLSIDGNHYDNKNAIVIVGSGLPVEFGNNDISSPDKIVLDNGCSFELRSIVLLRGEAFYSSNPSNFESVRYMRHGGHFNNWWKQERSDELVTRCSENIVAELLSRNENDDSSSYFEQHILVYIKEETVDVDKWRLKILQSVGGSPHVQCGCNLFPLIPTNAQRGKKQKCYNCNKVESFVCCNRDCPLRMCKKCHSMLPKDAVTTINPNNGGTQVTPLNNHARNGSDDTTDGTMSNTNNDDCEDEASDDDDETEMAYAELNSVDGSIHYDDENGGSSDGSSSGDDSDNSLLRFFGEEEESSDEEESTEEEESSDNGSSDEDGESSSDESSDEDNYDDGEYPSLVARDDSDFDSDTDSDDNDDEDDDTSLFNDEGNTLDNFVTYADVDETQEQTEDNTDLGDEFYTTQAGDIPVHIEHNPDMDRVQGHVLYNQAAVCTTRNDKRITGSQPQRHFVQRLCATTPGQASPILSLEQCLGFGRIFWSCATSDRHAVLGALPSWAYSSTSYPNGFASLPDTVRSRVTASGQITGTCPHYHRFLFDILGNKALSKGDSRQIINRGFQVDASHPMGISTRNNNQDGLTECIDSHDMVRGLAAAQEYILFDLFITFTANHSKTPGLQFLHHWKRSEKWGSHFRDYHTMPNTDRQELRHAMEEASGPVLLRNWVEVRTFILKYLKDHESFLGCKAAALFSRDEYQKDKGNLFHQHLVWAHMKDDLSPRAVCFFEELIRTSVFEIVKTDEIHSLMDRGLLKSVDEVNDVVELAQTCLTHICGERCKRLVTSTKDDDPKNYKCRKKHPVKDSPDCSTHQYIPMNVTLSPSCIQALQECGLCTTDENDEIKFLHPYFCPTSHMAPCNMNADCNMSPVITELFLLVKAMCNVQSVTHANGIIKYILKYIAKFDLANRAMASADAHSGATKVRTEFLHDTKITYLGTTKRLHSRNVEIIIILLVATSRFWKWFN